MELIESLATVIARHVPFAIAFSGGCDSTLLAEAVRRVVGKDKTVLLLADSILLPRMEWERAVAFARQNEFQFEVVGMDPLAVAEVAANVSERCYFCKRKIFGSLKQRAAELGFTALADGTNADDLGDYRPGLRAAEELSILHPFLEARINKAQIRSLAHEWGLAVWNLPAAACLASRIPVNDRLSQEKLREVEIAEQTLAPLFPDGFRVRRLAAGKVRLELRGQVEPGIQDQALRLLQKLGFTQISIDSYQMGAMNTHPAHCKS